MSTLSYTAFGQSPNEHPVTAQQVTFPHQPTSGNWFGEALGKFEELWQVDADQPKQPNYYPLLEDVPYSKRLEIAPFDPELYRELNSATLGPDQENPASLHFFDDTDQADSTNTQAFISHSDEVVLIAVRGSAQLADFIRDADATQVPFKGGGRVHDGFHGATQALEAFVTTYLDKFHTTQKLLITGHSLGGAIALLLSEVLRRRQGFDYDIVLYTYGAPRAADSTFIDGAADLVHYRMVNHDDPVPSVPAPWMNTSSPTYGAGSILTFVNVPTGMTLFAAGLVNARGDPYGHHGHLRHFMPVTFENGHRSSILWAPGCETITQHACARALKQTDGLPERAPLLGQILRGANHSMVGGYIPNCWATLRRWQEALEGQRSLVTEREFEWVDRALTSINRQLDESPSWLGQAMQARREELQQTLRNERRKVETTQQRLATLRFKTVTQSDVYGSVAATPQVLANALARWNAHPDNTSEHPLAMAPALVMSDEEAIATIIGGHVIGAPYTFDIDSIT
ncbi:lipase family protein [Pseudomonas sp. M47T1]|nr:lipase family protein [Pseudomonas sp. M47T1]